MSVRTIPVQTALVLLLLCCVAPVFGEESDDGRAVVRLVSDTAEVAPGATFRLGAHFEIDDGWHIYWRYPGGAGLATAVDFELPEGMTAGPLRWPLPIAFTQAEGIPGYGYEDSVILAADIAVPEGFRLSPSSTIRAEVSWLACKDVCVLGSAELDASLGEIPVDPAFGGWNQRLPSVSGAGEAPFTHSTTGGLTEGVVTLWLRWRDTPGLVEWFPDPPDALEIGDIRIQTRGGLTRIDAEIKTRRGAIGSTETLPSLVVATDRGGSRRGWEVPVHLQKENG